MVAAGSEKPDYTRESVHDVIFLVLFLVWWCGMWIIANTAMKYGNPAWLLLAIDSHGNRCGTPVTYNGISLEDKPVLYYTNPAAPAAFPSVCLASCPNTTATPSSTKLYCDYGVNPYATGINATALQETFTCAALIIKSESVLGRCIPNDPAITTFAASGLTTASNSLQSILTDVENCWPFYIGAVFLALIISFLWAYLLKIFAKPMVWFTVILVNLTFGGIALFCYFFWQKEYAFSISNEVGHDAVQVEWQWQTAKYGCFIFTALFAICVLVTIFMRNKIRIACEVLKETSTAIGKMPVIIFFPLLLWLAAAILFVYFIFITLYIVSINSSITLSAFNLPMTQTQVNYLLVYHLFGFFWCYAFFQGFNQMTIAGSFATYYWTLDKSNMPKHPVRSSMWRTARYHLGSIALGAMLIAIVQTLRCVMLFVKRLAKKSSLKILVPLINCCQCYLAWLEKLVKWINKNGYIMVAITGDGFCKSCGHALALLIRNGLKLIAVDLVGDMIILLSKVCITSLVVLIFYFFINWQADLIDIQFIYVPLVIIGIIALFVASGFMGVYEMGIDTIFLSFLEDSERNDGSLASPYYMSDALKNIMHVSNKMREEDAKKRTKRVEPMAMEEY
ncbi:plasma-membrane choline transporter-domain-containing protein [Obelidium mucronatum]|nr:plasma-membrane choline transporter-domain-containing protein [Obelidium mucronatum]